MSLDTIRAYIGRLPERPQPDRLLHRTGPHRVAGRAGGITLGSVFQPIVNRDGALVAHQAFFRDMEHGAPAHAVLEAISGEDAVVRFDRTCRTVHVLNRFASGAQWAPLFLCVDHRLLQHVPEEHGATFQRILSGFGVLASRVVIVLPSRAATVPGLLEGVLPSYRLRNFRIAVEVAGWPAADAARLGRLRPDFVVSRWNAGLRAWAAAAHDTGAQLLATHVEQAGQSEQALADGADLLQGFHVGRPAEAIPAIIVDGARLAADEAAR